MPNVQPISTGQLPRPTKRNSRSFHFASPPHYAKNVRSGDPDFASVRMTTLLGPEQELIVGGEYSSGDEMAGYEAGEAGG
jgi:hypothetical protein